MLLVTEGRIQRPVCNLYRDEHRRGCLCRLLLPAEQYALCYPIAAGHLCKARIRQYRLLEYLPFVRFAELPTPTLTRRWVVGRKS